MVPAPTGMTASMVGRASVRRALGFTLVELLIVLVVLGVLVVLVAPNLGPILDRNAARATANTLVADFAFARGEAVRRGGSVAVCSAVDANAWSDATDCGGDDDWTRGWVVYATDSGDLLRVGVPSTRAEISSTVVTRSFDALGLSMAGTFEVVAGSSERCVRLERSGAAATTVGGC